MRRVQAAAVAVVAAGLLINPGFASADQPSSESAKSASSAKEYDKRPSDTDFVKQAAVGGNAEVKMGQLASQRAQHAQVKQFAERMVRDHTQANDELAQAAQKSGIQVPGDVDEKHQQELDKLSKLSGAEFDKAYMEAQVKGHHETVSLLQEYAKNGKDADVKAWAQKTLTVVQDHTKQAEQVGSQVGVTARHGSAAHGAHAAATK